MAELGVGDLLPAAAQRVMMFLSWVALAGGTAHHVVKGYRKKVRANVRCLGC